MWQVMGGIAWAGMILMPFIGIIPGLCIMIIGLLLSWIASEKKTRQPRSKDKNKCIIPII